jgi:hypothetical protein
MILVASRSHLISRRFQQADCTMALGKSAKVVQPRDDVSSSMLFAMRMSAFQATQSRLDAENPSELDSLTL